MPSPFPGMDPFIESQRFDEFHNAFVMIVKEELIPLVRPEYIIDVDRYVFLSSELDQHLYRPDVSLAKTKESEFAAHPDVKSTLEPQILMLPSPEEDEQAFLTVRRRDHSKIITMIELLSPVNKEASQGQIEYLAKRANYLRTMANIVEIDLLRGGSRLPTEPVLDSGDYSTYVIRHGDRTHVEGYTWGLRDQLPVIPIPLAIGDPDVGLNLQNAFDKLYDRHGYDYSLDYKANVQPTLKKNDQDWVEQQLKENS